MRSKCRKYERIGRKHYIAEAINMNLAGRKCRAEANKMNVGRRKYGANKSCKKKWRDFCRR